MENVNRTLYIPLYGKALVSEKGILLKDKKAQEIWAKEAFKLKGKSKSKWLAYYMAMRARVFDEWVKANAGKDSCQVLHIGCGLDSRVERVQAECSLWADVDFPDVIQTRKLYYAENENYRMIGADAREIEWLEKLPNAKTAIVVMEGISMYLAPEELKKLLSGICGKYESVRVLIDCYTVLAAKLSKHRNPVNDVGVTNVYGIDDPQILTEGTGFSFVKEWELTPAYMIEELQGLEKKIFQKLYAGGFSKKLYKMYEYEKTRC